MRARSPRFASRIEVKLPCLTARSGGQVDPRVNGHASGALRTPNEEGKMEGKKLTLSKETLRTLDDDQLVGVVGGQPTNGVVCVNTVICQSGVCGSVACDSVVCNSAVCDIDSIACNSVICDSGVCNSVAICNVG